MYVRTGDLVQVIAGKNKGETGRVSRVDRSKDRVFVDGVNLVTRHQRPNQIQEGGRFQKTAPIHVSNVRLYSEEDERVDPRFLCRRDRRGQCQGDTAEKHPLLEGLRASRLGVINLILPT